MHPVIQLSIFLIFSVAVTAGNMALTLSGLALLLWAKWRVGAVFSDSTWRLLRRLRWLFLSLVILYFWFTPGRLLIPVAGDFSPTIEGMEIGLVRLLGIALVVYAMEVLRQSLTEQGLLRGLIGLLKPLTRLGINSERLAVRLQLTLAYFWQQKETKQVVQQTAVTWREWPNKMVETLAERFEQALVVGDYSKTVELDLSEPIPVWQWLFPVAMIAVFISIFWVYA